MQNLYIAVTLLLSLSLVTSFSLQRPTIKSNRITRTDTSKMMIELQANAATYTAMFVITIIPSLAFVKFIGDQADVSRDSLSVETQDKFKKSMMEQPGQKLGVPSTEEESLKKQIAKAYMQDKDVDIAVLEKKLQLRATWRKEMMIKAKTMTEDDADEDGW
jgi:hypothetical protein|mmetsp:Transcript_8240/g.8231  ORF Transcript_8240/g.8231 Transcript_8240/m.8231 type:complete len:161 (+) Transcript_8240:101-583(+)